MQLSEGYTYTIFIEYRQANSSRWIHIRVKETLREFTLWRLARVIFTEMHCQWEISTLPISLQQVTYSVFLIHMQI